jgi:hypothetical protein
MTEFLGTMRVYQLILCILLFCIYLHFRQGI